MQRKESKEFLDDLTTRDQRMMFAVMTLAITADTKEQLDSDTEAVLSVARKHMCQLAVLKFQQLDGLNTALPIGVRKINAFRTLTTESLAVFIPFKVQEIQDKGGIYFGENAISHNLIMCNKANLLNQSAFLLGVPGAGKSFSAKELIAFLMLHPDYAIRARCSQLADTVEGKVRQTKVMVSTAKENLISSAKQMVQTFREKGRSALCHAAQALHIPSVLSRMGRGFAHSEKSMGQLAVRLDSMREELHQAGGHIKNAGLALTGKEPQESKELSADKGVLAKLRSFVLSCGKVFSEMERDMALTVERINGGRSSVKTELQGLRSAQAGQRRQAASKEQAR